MMISVLLLGLMSVLLLYAHQQRINLSEAFCVGAKEGITLTFQIIPNLLAFIVAIGMFKAAKGFELIASMLSPVINLLHIPVELLSLALIRPFSGAAANGMLSSIAQQFGGDSYLAYTAAIMMGSTETTFYVLAVYFGSIGITHYRYAPLLGILIEMIGVISAIWVSGMCLVKYF